MRFCRSNAEMVNLLDCNGWSPKYKPASTAMRMRCTDMHGGGYDATPRT
jgi:hypothetical protein